MSSITAGTTSTTTLVHSGDTTGSLVFKTNDTGSGGTTAVTLDTSQNATFAGKVTSAGALTLASNGTTTAVTIDTSQNVGIGITSYSGYKLSVGASKTNVGFELYSSGSGSQGGYLNFRPSLSAGNEYNCSISAYDHSGDTNTDGISINGYDGVSFCTGSNSRQERMRIDSSGNLLVGTTTNQGAGVTISGVQGNAFWFSKTTSSTAYNHLVFNNPNGNVGFIQTSGSGTSFLTSSDYRLKENIAPMQGALSKVAQLNPVTYKWKVDGSDGQGFIAHELQEIVPDCVTGTKDAVDADGNPVYQGIDTSFLVATLTAALQETKALIDQQAETINALTARVVALEGQ